MAVYKIFPEKDTTIYSAYPNTNAGWDQILEIQNQPISINGTPEVSRVLIQFSPSDIHDVLDNKIKNTGSYKAYLRLFLADAYNLPDSYLLFANIVSESWQLGTGRFLYNPPKEIGVTWAERSNGYNWPSGGFAANTTASFKPGNPGGGAWYTISQSSQPFTIVDTKDTLIPVTDIINGFHSYTFPNCGFIVKMDDLYEFSDSVSYSLKFFSKNSHTIYLPQLEFRWDDSIYDTGSLKVLTNENIVVTLGNNVGEYRRGTTYRFRVNARVIFPKRAFLTQSVYLFNDALPSASYWALQDLDTGEYVVDFDENYTKVSCDPNGNYFDLYTQGLQPERYYKVLIKSSFASGSSTVIYDNNYTFKIFK